MALIWVSAGSPAALQGSMSPSLESQVCGAQVLRPHPLNPEPDPAEMRHQTPLHWESPQATASNSTVSGALGMFCSSLRQECPHFPALLFPLENTDNHARQAPSPLPAHGHQRYQPGHHARLTWGLESRAYP